MQELDDAVPRRSDDEGIRAFLHIELDRIRNEIQQLEDRLDQLEEEKPPQEMQFSQ